MNSVTKSQVPSGYIRMRKMLSVLCLAGLLIGITHPAIGNRPEHCCVSGGMYGDGSDGDWVIDVDMTLSHDMDYRNLTVMPGVALDTAGFAIRVCGTLTNHGIITDTESGGAGGVGGSAGTGADPWQDSDLPDCPPRDAECGAGEAGLPGESGDVLKAGRGGDGGSGAGGGGGASWQAPWDPEYREDADGGDGGQGGHGGQGGGYVRICTLNLDNQGLIHADGTDGHRGADGPTTFDACGAEYQSFGEGVPPDYYKDLAGGGGGGGTGGNGGNGGTVEIRYAHLINRGEVHADGGAGGAGGTGGPGATQQEQVDHPLIWGADPGQHDPGCTGAPEGGGAGGRGAHELGDEAGDGENGAIGQNGSPGTCIVSGDIHDCNLNGLPDECDLSHGGYHVTDLGKPAGYNDHSVYAYGINNATQIVGALQVPDILPEIASAFVWEDGEMTILPTLPESPEDVAIAYAINDAGQIVGMADAYPEPSEGYIGHNWHAVRWHKNGNGEWEIEDLDPPTDYHRAVDINSQGQIAVWWYGNEEADPSACIWLPEPACGFSEPGLHCDLADGHDEQKSWAINDHGNIAVWSFWIIDGWIWWGSGLWECATQSYSVALDLSEPHDINNDNIIVGTAGAAFICWYEDEDGWESIVLPDGGAAAASAQAINDAQDIVGWSSEDGSQRRACVWRHQGEFEYQYLDLNELIPSPTAWLLFQATDLNTAGEIVGYGAHFGQGRAFLLTPRTGADCNENAIPDECELHCRDCNGNGIPDECDIADGTSVDVNPQNGIPDECDWDDCNENGIADWYDIQQNPNLDKNGDGVLDECQCIADMDESGTVDVLDLLELLGDWGCDRCGCRGDINCDCVVNTVDLLLLLGEWGDCP